MVLVLAVLLQSVMHYYWQEAPDSPGWHYLMVGSMQAGAFNEATGLYYRRLPGTTDFVGPENPPYPPPRQNFGVRIDKVQEEARVTRKGAPVDRKQVIDAIDQKIAPPRPWNAYSWLPAVMACAGLSFAACMVVFLRRRR